MHTMFKIWALSFLLFSTGCCCCGGFSSSTPSTDPWVATGEGDTDTPEGGTPGVVPDVVPDDPTTGEPVAGGELNQFFPEGTDELSLTYKQEKEGFALANLSRDGVEVASLSISDTRSEPDAAGKYEHATDDLGGYPLAAMGSKGTGILVGDRFQVSARSLDDSFTEADRRAWLEKFDLDGLSQLK